MKPCLHLLGFIALACTALCISATSPSHFRSRLQKMRFAAEDPADVDVKQSEVVLHGIKLVSQTHFRGERLGDHDHHCFLAAVLTVANHLAPDQERTMNDYWEKLVRLAGSPKALKSELADDRIRRTFSKIAPNKHTFENLYFAALSYNPAPNKPSTGDRTPNKPSNSTPNKSPNQLELMWTALSNGWPIIFGIGPPSTSAAEIGHYVVLAGARRNAHHVVNEFLIYDPWWFTDREQTEEPGEKRKDGGKWLPVPEVGAGLALRASNGWAILEVYLPAQLDRPAAQVMRERSDKLRGPARAPAPVARGAADKDAKDKSAKEKAAARF